MSLSHGNLLQHGASIRFYGCEAHAGYGGGLAVSNGDLMQDAGSMQFTRCSADAGGGLFVQQQVRVLLTTAMTFADCTATRDAPGGPAQKSLRFQAGFACRHLL